MLFPCLFLIPGCWDRAEINETAIAVALGVDTASNDQILFTVQLLAAEQEGAGEKQPSFVTVSAFGSTLTTAAGNIMLKNPRSILWQHSAVMVLGEDLAEKGLSGLADELARNRNIRQTDALFVARKATAAEVLSIPTPVDKIPGTALESMIRIQDVAAGIYSQTLLHEFISRTAAPGIEPAVPGIAVVEREHGKKYLELSGTAVFRQGKLLGWLNETESRGYRWLRPKMVLGGTITVKCPACGQPVLIQNVRSQSQLKPELRAGHVVMHIKVRGEGFFYEQRCLHQLVTPEMMPILNQHVEGVIKNQITSAVVKAQALNSDIFGFGAAVRRKYPDQWAALEPRWDEIFPAIKLEFDVDAHIRRTNLRSQTARLKY